MTNIESDLFAIKVCEDEEIISQQKAKVAARAARTTQLEEAFKVVQAGYIPKIENGEIHKSVTLPLRRPAGKMEAAAIMQGIEELYFFGRFSEVVGFAERVLAEERKEGGNLEEDVLKVVEGYRERCLRRMTMNETI